MFKIVSGFLTILDSASILGQNILKIERRKK